MQDLAMNNMLKVFIMYLRILMFGRLSNALRHVIKVGVELVYHDHEMRRNFLE